MSLGRVLLSIAWFTGHILLNKLYQLSCSPCYISLFKDNMMFLKNYMTITVIIWNKIPIMNVHCTLNYNYILCHSFIRLYTIVASKEFSSTTWKNMTCKMLATVSAYDIEWFSSTLTFSSYTDLMPHPASSIWVVLPNLLSNIERPWHKFPVGGTRHKIFSRAGLAASNCWQRDYGNLNSTVVLKWVSCSTQL